MTTEKKVGNPNFKPQWNNKTIAIRLPEKFKDELIYLARLLDQGLSIDDLIDSKLKPDQPETPPENLKDVEATKLKILKSLKLGSQSPTYKKIEKALNQFIEEVF